MTTDFEKNMVKPEEKTTETPEYAKKEPVKLNISLFDEDGQKKSQSTLLIEIGMLGMLFHDENRNAYAEVKQGDIKEVYKVRSRDYREYLGHELYKLIGKGANATSILDAINTLEAVAKHDGEQKPVAIRVSHIQGAVFIDPGCPKRRIIKINESGWSYTREAPVKFIRKNGMTDLPEPSHKADIALLRKYINVCDQELPLIYGWLFCALAGIRPYPILILQGEQGTGKSTTSRVIRSLVDPSSVPLRSPPRDIRDLLVSAGNTHCVVLDNLSGLNHEVADTLCRLSTGGGIDVRALYTDNEQYLVELQKPILANGIDDIATRPDLAERSIIINLPVISNAQRLSERDFWQSFEQDKPKILSALFQAISSGLKYRDQINLTEKPRMADVVQWVTACERGLDIEGAFIQAHYENQLLAVESAIESSPIGSAIVELMSDLERWTGKPTELLSDLERKVDVRQSQSKAWPQSLKGLRNVIKRLQPNFRKLGLEITHGKDGYGNRFYRIEKV